MTTIAPPAASPFYITGGTLPPDALSYVERQADRDLLQALQAGDYCYVLNSRQMGKSSLCVRTMTRLREAGTRTVFLDLTKFGGRNLTAEQWYAALLAELGRDLGLRAECLQYWKEHPELPPVQRLFGAITEVALPALGARCSVLGSDTDTDPAGPVPSRQAEHRAPSTEHLVLFIDEIDVTRSLPFNTDEFFAAIRQCYVGRATEPALQQVTFCLLGTATPAELIEDTRISPFNIGRRIEVRDFTPEEAAPLAMGLAAGTAGVSPACSTTEPAATEHAGETPALPAAQHLLARILHWTGGHPYLTQRLCRALAEANAANPKSKIQNPKSVDALCASLFLTHTAREGDDNLALVRNRLLKSDADLPSLLDLYGKVRAGKRVADDETNALCGVLKLSGVVKVGSGQLVVRNRIYGEVFDRAWVRQHMPDAEVRRQRAAYWRGVVGTAASSAVLIAFMALQINATREATRRANASQLLAGNRSIDLVAALRREREQRQVASAKTIEAREQARRANETANKNAELAHQRAQALQRADEQTRVAQQQAKLASENARRAEQEKGRARAAQARATYQAYVANMNLIQSDWENGNVGRIQTLLAASHGYGGRGFEWGYWNRLCHLDLRTLKGHTDRVWSACFSPDGRRIVTGSSDNTAKVWDAASGRALLTLRGHTGPVNAVSFSPDGGRILTGSDDNTAKVWDTQSGRETLTLKGHTVRISAVGFSPDGRRILTGSGGRGAGNGDPTARVWDAASGRELLKLTGHTGGLWAASFSPEGSRIVTGSEDETARVWDAVSGREMRTLRGHSSWVLSVGFSPDGSRIVTGSSDTTAKVWDTVSGREMLTLKGHTVPVNSVCFSPDGSRIVTAGAQTAKVWDAANGRETFTLTGHTGAINSARFSPDGRHILTSSWDKTAKLWDAVGGREMLTLKGHAGAVRSVSFSPDSRRIVTSGEDDTARVWNAANGHQTLTLPGHGVGIIFVRFSPDGQRIVTGSINGRVTLWDAASGRETLVMQGHRSLVSSVSFSADGRRIVTGSNDRTAKVWDVRSGRELLTLQGHTGPVRSVSFSPDGRRIVTGSADKMAKVWDAANGRDLLTLQGHTGPVWSVSFAPDGRRIVTSGEDAAARVWDAASGRELLALQGHGHLVSSASFSPDGRRIVTGSFDTTAKLWDAASGREMLTLKGHNSVVISVSFSPDGRRIVTGSADRTAKVWFSENSDMLGRNYR